MKTPTLVLCMTAALALCVQTGWADDQPAAVTPRGDDQAQLDRDTQALIDWIFDGGQGLPLGGCDISVPGDFATIQAAVDAAMAGEVICVGPATYVENVVITTDNLTIQSTDGAGMTKVDGDCGGSGVGPTFDVTANGVTIDGFEIINGGGDGGIAFEGSDNVFKNNDIHDNCFYGVVCFDDALSNDNTIEANDIHDNVRSGILIGRLGNTGNTIRDNTVWNNSTEDDCFWVNIELVNGFKNTITGNIVFASALPAIHTGILLFNWTDLVSTGSNIVKNNEVFASDTGSYCVAGITVLSWTFGGTFHGFGCDDATNNDNLIVGNNVHDVAPRGIFLWAIPSGDCPGKTAAVDNNHVHGNTITNCDPDAIQLGANGGSVDGNTLDCNDIADCDRAFRLLAGTGSGNVYRKNNIDFSNGFGVSNGVAVSVAADNNWWGHATGPDDPDDGDGEVDNPGGAGTPFDPADDFVDFTPFATAVLPRNALILDVTGDCFIINETVTVTLSQECLTTCVVGYQAFLEFDTGVLTHVSTIFTTTPYALEILNSVSANQIDLAAGIDAGTQTPTADDALLVTMTFTVIAESCNTAGLVSFRTNTPPTQFTDDEGNRISTTEIDLPAITIDVTAPVFDQSCPLADIDVNADAGTCEAAGSTVNPTVATATDTCDPAPVVDFVRSDNKPNLNDPYEAVDSPITITWTATDFCGNSSQCVQTVTVNAVNDLVLDIELSPTVDTSLTRCITLELWDCPDTIPIEIVQLELTFTSGLFSGTVEVPCGNYTCITVRDELHTLRRTLDPLVLSGTQWEADFVTPGKKLIGGNLNDDLFIDILDFGVFVGEFGANYGTGDTTCATPFPHADISGNGLVGTEDFTFISVNFLASSEANCCGAPGAQDGPAGRVAGGPITRISVKQLRRMGLGDLIVGDLNHDGWLDTQDMVEFFNGDRP